MKTLQATVSVMLGFSALVVSNPVYAQATIDRVDNGNLSVTRLSPGSGCTVLFSSQGELLQNGSSCSSRDISEAQAVIDGYLREQGTPVRYPARYPGRNNINSTRQRLTLICYGEGRKPGFENRSEYEWSERLQRYQLLNRVASSTNNFDSQVQVEIRNQRGKIHLTGKLIPPIHSGGVDGWWNLDDLKVTRDRITGRYRMNALNRPKVDIDRRTGQIAINGIERFRGTCDSGDWGGNRNRF